MKNSIITLFLLHLTFIGFAQDSLTYQLSYDVHVNYPPISISKQKLNEARTLSDLNARYNALWMREYISVEILSYYKGTLQIASSKNDTLNQQQKDYIDRADVGTDISVKVRYIPDNNLIHNDMKEYKFSFTVNPKNEARYIDGPQQLKKYLKETAIDKIPAGSLKQYQLAAVKFIVNETGQVVNPAIFFTSKDEKVDAILLQAIRKMPDWQPATYFNGTKTKQTFVFTVGDMESCNVNLLNIHKNE